MKQRVLFICSGNYYRSRYAEILFNHLANEQHLNWEALSCGTEVYKFQNEGPISKDTVNALINVLGNKSCFERYPMQIDERQLELADIVIALKQVEHQAPLARDFPHYEKKVVYWHVHDLDAATCEEAFGEINELVKKLVKKLVNGEN